MLLEEGDIGPITVIGYEGATRKFDELGGSRMMPYPSVGKFEKAFHRPSFVKFVEEVHKWLDESLK